jgi:hypothetical protein
VVHCISHGDCPSARFDPERTNERRSADAEVAVALERVAGRYDRLAAELKPIVQSERVLVTGYFDPTRNSDGDFCARSLPGVAKAELQWAADSLLTPLNFEIAAAAVRNGWQFVPGIARDFARHGYCASGPETWVVRLKQSLFRHRGSRAAAARLAGTLHPNEAGHLAIADRLAPMLAATLGLTVTERPPAPEEDEDSVLVVVLAVVAAAAVVALGLLVVTVARAPRDQRLRAFLQPLLPAWKLVKRLFALVRPTEEQGAVGQQAAAPVLPRLKLPRAWPELLAKSAAGIASLVVSAGFVSLVGAAILWVRFWAARIPADDALAAVPESQLLVVGGQALIVFGLLAVAAVVVVWLLDGKGRAIRASRRGLAALIVAELLLAMLLADLPEGQLVWLLIGFVLGAFLLHFLVDRALGSRSVLRASQPLAKSWTWWKTLFKRPKGEDEAPIRPLARVAWRAFPLLLLAGALYFAFEAHGLDRWVKVLGPIALAAVLFVAPGGVAGVAPSPNADSLEPPRHALALTTLVCLFVLLARDERWLAGAAVVAALLAGACLAIAGSSGMRFAPYGVAVLLSVPIFGAAVRILSAWDSPEAQPVAAISENLERTVCGLFVAETDDRLYLARVELDELGQVRRPRARRSRLTSIPRDKLAATAVGPLQPVGRAQDRALALRRELLLQAHAGEENVDLRGQSCAAREPPEPFVESKLRRLANRYQPELVIDRKDGFWPVPVRTIFSMEDRRARACRRIDPAHDDLCVRLTLQGDLPWSGGDGEWIEFPADNKKDDQRRLAIDALGSVDPARSSREYFLVSGADQLGAPLTLQYWFFYTYNYQPVKIGSAGHHEGDFESVGLLLSARTHRPRYMWMARHSDEGRMFAWDEVALQRRGNHPHVFVARGSHASYENCLDQARRQAPAGLIDDHPTCHPQRQLRLAPESTTLTDLSRVPWACWRGLFGHVRGNRIVDLVPYIEADAPRSPLWQQSFGGVRAEPCRGIDDPGRRDGPGEELLPRRTVKRLRRDAGRLDPLVDQCTDWERPPATGTYLLACDHAALQRYVASGFEKAGRTRVHIDVAEAETAAAGSASIPAVRRDPLGRRFDDWRIVATGPTQVDVFASCQRGKKLQFEVRFPSVALKPRQPLRLDDRLGTRWRLRRDDGLVVASAAPIVARGKLGNSPLACG